MMWKYIYRYTQRELESRVECVVQLQTRRQSQKLSTGKESTCFSNKHHVALSVKSHGMEYKTDSPVL